MSRDLLLRRLDSASWVRSNMGIDGESGDVERGVDIGEEVLEDGESDW
jgi:hypothetical protein